MFGAVKSIATNAPERKPDSGGLDQWMHKRLHGPANIAVPAGDGLGLGNGHSDHSAETSQCIGPEARPPGQPGGSCRSSRYLATAPASPFPA